MSITITVRPQNATSGGTDQVIVGDGGIDTREEAEAALTFLPDGSTDTVVVGEDSYTRDQLIGIRDGVSPSDEEDGETVRGEGVSHGFAIEGSGYAGLGDPTDCEVVDGEAQCGDPGHDGGGVALRYVAGIPIGDTGLYFDPTFGFRVNHGEMTFNTPGGEEGTSAFTSFGATLGADLRYKLPPLEERIWASLGLRFGISPFVTAEGEKISIPGNCVPDEFGRQDCSGEPIAGADEHYDGLSGVYVPRVKAARPDSGVALDFEIPITVGANVVQDEWGSLGLAAQFIPGLTGLLPSEGDGFSFWRMGGGLSVVGRFGGADARVAKSKEEPVDEEKKLEELEGVSMTGIVSSQAADAAGQQFIVKLAPPQDGEITKSEIIGAKGKVYGATVDPSKLKQTGELLVTPKEKLPTGKYTFRFEILGDDGKERVGKVSFEVKDVSALDVKITPDAGNAAAEKTESPISFGITTNKKVTIAPRFVLQGTTAGLQSVYYPDPKTYEMDASQPGQAASFNLKTPNTLPAGTYTVVFDVTGDDGTVKRVTSTLEVKKMDAKPVFEIPGSFKIGETLAGKMKPSEKVAPPGMPVTYVISGPGGSSPQRTATLTEGSVDLNLSCPPALLTKDGKIYRTSKKGTYKVTVTYANGKTADQSFEVK